MSRPRTYAPDLVEKARHLAFNVHFGQYDNGGRPYIEHPMRVATYTQITSRWCGLDADEQYIATIAAWLHDVVEDSREGNKVTNEPPVTFADLLRKGFPLSAVEAITLLTRPEEKGPEIDEAYYAGIAPYSVPRAVKWADMLDNTDPYRLAQLSPSRQQYLIDRYDKGAACLKISPSPTQWWTAQALRATTPGGQSILTAPEPLL